MTLTMTLTLGTFAPYRVIGPASLLAWFLQYSFSASSYSHSHAHSHSPQVHQCWFQIHTRSAGCSDRDREEAQGLMEYSNRRSFSVDMFIDIERGMMAKLWTYAFSRFLKSNRTSTATTSTRTTTSSWSGTSWRAATSKGERRGMQGGRSKLNKMF